MDLPLNEPPLNVPISQRDQRPWLPTKKLSELEHAAELSASAARMCLRRFKPHQQMLWQEAKDKEGLYLLDNEGNPKLRVVGRRGRADPVVMKLWEVAPLSGFPYSSTWRDGVYAKVSDLLRSYAGRSLNPRFTEKTSYPAIRGGFPIVFQKGFVFYEHVRTKKLYLYLPLFPRAGHKEDLPNQYNPKYGPSLRVFGDKEVKKMITPFFHQLRKFVGTTLHNSTTDHHVHKIACSYSMTSALRAEAEYSACCDHFMDY